MRLCKGTISRMKTRGQKIVDRILVSLGGGIVLCLDAFPLGVSIWFLYELMGSDGLPHKSSTIAVGFVSLLLFGAIACYAVRRIVRSWHNLVEVERMIESMTPSEKEGVFLKA